MTANTPLVLIADDDAHTREIVRQALAQTECTLAFAASAVETWQSVSAEPPELLLLDLRFPDCSDLSLLNRIRREAPSTEIIVLSGNRDIGTVVESIKAGAFDYVAKPFVREELCNRVAKALELQQLRKSRQRLLRDLSDSSGVDLIVGESLAIRRVRHALQQLADGEVMVLIAGESGTGKELAARTLHFLGHRRDRPFVGVNAAAIPENLAESVLFGHRRGAFTGSETSPGYFEAAADGTLFLDEIGDMPLAQQRLLLRVLEDRRFKPLGHPRELTCAARFIFATNHDLRLQTAEGAFRADLYYRISAATVVMPALREHAQDIALIAGHFCRRLCMSMGRRPLQLGESALRVLERYRWPGNVRELRNTLETAIMVAAPHQEELSAHDLPEHVRTSGPESGAAELLPVLKRQERDEIRRVLQLCDGNQCRAATMLGLHRNTLRRRLRAYELSARTRQPKAGADAGGTALAQSKRAAMRQKNVPRDQ